jgi:hypothetical protein
MAPIAERNNLTRLQLACTWDLAQPAVRAVAPTLIQEAGPTARPIEAQRAELAAVASAPPLSAADIKTLRQIGDNTGCMSLKGAAPDHTGPDLPDRWSIGPTEAATAARWQIAPERDLARAPVRG